MKYLEGAIPKTKQQLLDRIASAMLRVPRRHFPEGYGHDFEGTFYSIERGVGNLRRKIGDSKADQLLEMLSQAKAHYEAGDNKLGGSLMEDTKMVLMDRQPWAYPKELYRWGADVSLPELSEVDLLNKGD
jgi:hypothetical protein